MDERRNKFSRFIEFAISEARLGDHKQRVGAVIFDKNRIVSKGHNYCERSVKKLHPMYQKYPGSIHAEVDSIIKAKRDVKGLSMLVIRINKKEQFRLAKPCIRCMKYIKYVGIKKVFYSIDNYPYIKELDSSELE